MKTSKTNISLACVHKSMGNTSLSGLHFPIPYSTKFRLPMVDFPIAKLSSMFLTQRASLVAYTRIQVNPLPVLASKDCSQAKRREQFACTFLLEVKNAVFIISFISISILFQNFSQAILYDNFIFLLNYGLIVLSYLELRKELRVRIQLIINKVNTFKIGTLWVLQLRLSTEYVRAKIVHTSQYLL